MPKKLALQIIVFLAATCSYAAWCQTNNYSLREDWGGTHSHTIARAPLPFNKSYGELTDEQRAGLRGDYVRLGENDEPPYPLDGNGGLIREIAKIQRLAMIEGELALIAQIDEKGDAQSVSIAKTPNANAAQAVAFALMRTKFKPAKCDGKPCAMEFPLVINFTLGG